MEEKFIKLSSLFEYLDSREDYWRERAKPHMEKMEDKEYGKFHEQCVKEDAMAMIFKRKDKETEREMEIIKIKKHSLIRRASNTIAFFKKGLIDEEELDREFSNIAGKYSQLNGRLEFLKFSLEYNNNKKGELK